MVEFVILHLEDRVQNRIARANINGWSELRKDNVTAVLPTSGDAEEVRADPRVQDVYLGRKV